MSAARSLAPLLEASVRLVKTQRWKTILDEASARVTACLNDVDKNRHTSAPTATHALMRALEDYYVLAEQARQEMANV